jgi:CheY-like chemotaxis protein
MTSENKKSNAVRVLVVEDDVHIGQLIGLTMPSLGRPYVFMNAMCAAEALELWKQEPYDLLLTDYNLAGMNGIELMITLKEMGATAPMVLFTAYDTPELERQATHVGVAAYLAKPFDIDDMLEIISELLPQEEYSPQE